MKSVQMTVHARARTHTTETCNIRHSAINRGNYKLWITRFNALFATARVGNTVAVGFCSLSGQISYPQCTQLNMLQTLFIATSGGDKVISPISFFFLVTRILAGAEKPQGKAHDPFLFDSEICNSHL